MGRPISGDYRLGRRLLFGVLDPSELDLYFELDGNRVYCAVDAKKHAGPAKVVPAGLVLSIADDLAHASLAALKKRIGVTRETRLRFLKPLYRDDGARADGTLDSDGGQGGVARVNVRIVNARDQLCVEGEIEVFVLTADQVRKMTPDGMVPLELKRFFA